MGLGRWRGRYPGRDRVGDAAGQEEGGEPREPCAHRDGAAGAVDHPGLTRRRPLVQTDPGQSRVFFFAFWGEFAYIRSTWLRHRRILF